MCVCLCVCVCVCVSLVPLELVRELGRFAPMCVCVCWCVCVVCGGPQLGFGASSREIAGTHSSLVQSMLTNRKSVFTMANFFCTNKIDPNCGANLQLPDLYVSTRSPSQIRRILPVFRRLIERRTRSA